MAVHQNADGRRGSDGGGGEISAALLSAILLPLLAAGSATAERTPANCVEVLVGVAPCLAFLAAPPINESSAPSSACCASVAAYTEAGGRRDDAGEGEGGGIACLCHLLRRPGLLGFPIVAARVPSLFVYCNSPDAVGSPSPDAAAGFRALCDVPFPLSRPKPCPALPRQPCRYDLAASHGSMTEFKLFHEMASR
ncbi:unnamed protein product [Spirodela intermedia]|uniref:Bifunctional inhibitor/plant lipid transfer protein/seed storage helical domain-containing protein n=1 Tax=Spirodela intermedia TaxID=51605 RepID=A0A7I8KC78_SPIIN|nr:unnamed protein product [Spirodela intermedia]